MENPKKRFSSISKIAVANNMFFRRDIKNKISFTLTSIHTVSSNALLSERLLIET